MSHRPRTTQFNDVADVPADVLQRTRAQQVGSRADGGKGKGGEAPTGRHRADRPERRRSWRGGVRGERARADLIAMIVGTYAEMPGLSLHPHQAARLFGLREATCLVVLSDLVRDGQLRQSANGQYRAANSAGV